jgi:16S rRNA (cytosine967-C5)-methyltransferase
LPKPEETTLQTSTVSPARWAAFQVLERVAKTNAHSDDLLHGPLLRGLSQADTALTHALVMGVLRWQLALEAELLPLLARPDTALPGAVATSLRLGAFQLRHMDRIPAHAALNESVELVRKAGQPQAAGMVNAVLRKIAAALKAPSRKPIGESLAAMSARLGHPEWLAARWSAAFGRKAAEAICEYDLCEPQAGKLFATEGPALDNGSRLVAELAAAATPHATRVWDTCAAPGGKTIVLAERLPGASVLATDISAKRLERMKTRVGRDAPGRIRTLVADAAHPPTELGLFDLILCDAPCSGTGTLARNPEIKVRLEPGDLERQSSRQLAILTAALDHLAPGGSLLYSTCSLEKEENETVVAEALRSIGGVALSVSLMDMMPALKAVLASGSIAATAEVAQSWVLNGCLRTLPGVNFTGDGFFAALFTRGA